MAISIKNSLLNNATIKVFSLILGYALWSILSDHHTKTISVTAPLCFYGQNENITIKAPESITVDLKGKKRELAVLDVSNLALHIDACGLKKGLNPIAVHNATLFLPDSICVVHYFPTKIFVDVQEKFSLNTTQQLETIT